MKIITNLNKTNNSLAKAVAIGSFDGVHLGHQAIIQKLISIAKENDLVPYIMFFEPLPKEFFLKEIAPTRIYDFRNKVINLHKMGIENIICHKFNQRFANIEAKDFIEDFLVRKLNTKHIIVGDDFKFGRNRIGDYALLKQYSLTHDFTVDRISTLNLDNHRISSSQIRQAIAEHDIEHANKLIGSSLKINSRVSHGQKNGRKIGFPTVNQKLLKNSVLKGVYLSKIYIDNQVFFGISNAGTRPTIDGKNNLLETHIFNFDEFIYGKHITTEIIDFIRPEKKFNSFDELKTQIHKDVKIAKKYFFN
ncbi:bifunctional riboflavin kinase/FAD synthetase [Francisella noatunensis]|uniref:Riboflavin biosynthesis protein n=1 Tax=Francisella noatunensis TaxID=657445 RepID=A0A9Q2L012_9GAMM|nr:bifunctional riboflavin kinase/FAD synthetase [Francisella noatunensis]MBK2029409.1 bifunctional riboflavin kinase/FAD synthetase [Francisella noatunensis]MBK2034033.1 bifunctional riboflavin kinase/FAD synthetase [Francisella noatunensis]MBK2049375.1 bifunctional riboflavin kinase/FAD synthetase [Francisella noatunensis]MBK2050824.1 bifunctional riboflavin kinase/FAD synthetase [Francisella noatunensis]MBK2052246.1 bifunctional riboflavin kinase/FAD synthetase [Francisella noatunensis]